MHKLFCIIGRTGSGKSTLVEKAANELGLKILKSYTTRPMRESESIENSDHIFISPDEVKKYRNDIVAYTERVNYCNFATKQQIMNADLYIINPSGYKELLKITITEKMDVELIPILINTSIINVIDRVGKSRDPETWMLNCLNENEEFTIFEHSNDAKYVIENNKDIYYAYEILELIINQELGKIIDMPDMLKEFQDSILDHLRMVDPMDENSVKETAYYITQTLKHAMRENTH